LSGGPAEGVAAKAVSRADTPASRDFLWPDLLQLYSTLRLVHIKIALLGQG
jgi:hypothetical protein